MWSKEQGADLETKKKGLFLWSMGSFMNLDKKISSSSASGFLNEW